ncbi:MAG: hypothetical protein GY950_10200 [bacterium]|nr:hypothetical protein [bacterium]
MKDNWETQGRTLERRAEAQLKSLKIPLRRRFDLILLFGLLGVFVILALAWGVGVIVGNRLGVFDTPPIRPLADERILTNIRESIYNKPLLDAVLHLDDRRIYISRKGGTVHSYDPATRLWREEKPALETGLLDPDIVSLRSGSGADSLSNHASECPDPESLWGVSARAGLVRRIDGHWQRIIGDSYFLGSRGDAVQKDQLTAAAVSGDSQWLVVGTKEDGIGLYHLHSRQWVPLQSRLLKSLPSATVSHLAWWQNRFWVGGPSGLVSLEIDPETRRPHAVSKTTVTGRITDLDVDLKNRLWVVENRYCRSGEGGDCLRISRFLHPQQPPQRLVDEAGIYPQLTTGDLYFAQSWGHRLAVAGQGGVFTYNTRSHGWERLFDNTVLSTLPLPGGNGFYFGAAGKIGIAAPNRYHPWSLPSGSERIKKLRFGRPSKQEILGLAESGKVFAVTGDKTHDVFPGTRTTFDPADFRTAFGFGTTVLFIGDQGALVHDIVTRSYKDIPAPSLPNWLRGADWEQLQFVSSGDDTFIAVSKDVSSYTQIYHVPTAKITAGNFNAAVRMSDVPGPVSRLRDWNAGGVVLIAGGNDRRVLQFAPAKKPLTGAGLDTLTTPDLLDVTPYKDGLMAATSEGLWSYSYLTRDWRKYHLLPGVSPREVTVFNGLLLGRTNTGQLFESDDSGQYVELIGRRQGFDISDNQLSDVMTAGGKVYLAGNGTVFLYDSMLRRIDYRWKLPGMGNVKLIGMVGDLPLALCDGYATLGRRALDSTAGSVVNLSVGGGYIRTVRDRRGQRYLERYPVNAPFTSAGESFFHRPGAGRGVTRLLDAVPLTEKTIAAATNKGLRFYSLTARSWYHSYPLTWIPGGDRIHQLGNHLVLTGREGNRFSMTFLKRDTLTIPAGTTGEPVTFDRMPVRVPVNAFSIDPAGRGAVFINREGRILEWSGGGQKEILPAPNTGPAPGLLRRVFDRGSGDRRFLLFTTDRSILRYDLGKHSWQEMTLSVPPAADMNIHKEGTTETVIVKTKAGAFYRGTFDTPGTGSSFRRSARRSILLTRIFTPNPGAGINGSRLRDVQERERNRWTFVLDDRIVYYNPLTRKWSGDEKPSTGDDSGDSPPPALDVGWLKWNRSAKTFEINTPTGKQTISPTDFIRDGRLIFEEADAVVVHAGNTLTANRHGVWTYPGGNLTLNNPGITFRPLGWGNVTGSGHQCFITGGGCYGVDGNLLPASRGRYRFTVGDVTFSEDIVLRRVGVSIKTTGGTVGAFADYGFTWDRDRSGVFYGKNSQILVRSAAGIHPANQYTGFQNRLNRSRLLTGQILSQDPEPSNRILIDNNTWTWEKRNGAVRIRLKGKSFNFGPLQDQGREGFGFSCDRLVDAAAHGDRLAVMTRAFFEVEETSGQFGGFKAPRYPARSVTRLESVNHGGPQDGFFIFSRAGNFYWHDQEKIFKPVTSRNDPFRERLSAAVPAAAPRLRFRLRRGRPVIKEVNVDHLDRTQSWIPFRFSRRSFPFDVVTSIAAVKDRLYVGPEAGLQVYSRSAFSSSAGTGLAQMEKLVHMGGTTAGPPAAVTRVGEPLRNPGTVLARSRYRCIQSSGSGIFQPCRSPASLDNRLREETSSWRFVERNGRLEGRYKDETGKLTSEPVVFRRGRLPHDRLTDILVFDRQVFTLWENGWVSLHNGPSMELSGVLNFNLKNIRPRRFVQVPVDISGRTPGVLLARGVYIEGIGGRGGRRFYRYHAVTGSGKGRWVEVVSSGGRAKLVALVDRPPIVNRGRLGLWASSARTRGFTFERRGPGGKWLPVPWKNGRVALDQWHDLFYIGGQLWAATAGGLTTFSRTADHRVVLDPDNFTVISEPGGLPEVTDVHVQNNVVTLRCEADGNKVYRGTFSSPVPAGKAIFQLLDNDPFAERELVDEARNRLWTWRLKGCTDRSPGWLEGTFRGETVRFIGGRFEFDTIDSLAFFRDHRVEIGTRVGGWYRAADGNLHLEDFVRPNVPGIDYTEVKGVLLTRAAAGDQPVLGLRTASGDYIRLGRGGTPRRTKGCPQFLGDDRFWRYERNGEILEISTAAGKGGKAFRTIENGRFTDDLVVGLPVTGIDEAGGIFYLVPTGAGVLSFDGDFKPRELHAGVFPGLEPGGVPGVIFLASSDLPLYVGSDGMHHLGGSRDVFPGLKIPVPGGVRLTAVEDGPQDFVRIRWQENQRRGWSLSRPGATGDAGDNTFFIGVNHFGKYMRNREVWGYPQPWLQVRFQPRRLEAYRPGSSRSFQLDFQRPIDLLTPVVVDESLFLIGRRNLLEVNLEHVMMESFGGAAKSRE